jgi:hypothetical protein
MREYSRMTKRGLVAALSLLCVATGGLTVGAGQAAAGTNGQHIHLIAHHGDGFGFGQINGINERGEMITSPRLHLTHSGISHKDQDRADSTQWWKGKVYIDWYNWRTGGYVTSSECDVPTNQGTSNNWVDCWAPAGQG